MDLTEQSPVILSLCPGIRGIERGLERIFQSVRVAAYVEIEAFIVENLLSAMEAGLVDAAPVWTNLNTFNPEPFRNRIDGIIGGYPCQPFSLAGDRKGIEDPRHLFPYICKTIKSTKPVWCFFENVSGHLSMGYPEVYRSLRDLGYKVEAGIFTAEEIGSTQERERLFILAILGDTGRESLERGGIRGGVDPQRRSEQNGQVIESSGSSALENTNGERLRRDNAGGFQPEAIRTGAELGNSESFNERDEWNQSGESERQNRRSGIELADSICTGLEVGRKQSTWKKLKAIKRGCDTQFPAGQGSFQYDWEESRTIESGLVYTINGYNFTEDLHRAIGNSVVEQTAELAFRDLLRKHYPE